LTKQEIWNLHNYSIEYPHVPNYVRVSDNHTGAMNWEKCQFNRTRKYKKSKLPQKKWNDEDRQFIRENYFIDKKYTAKQLAVYFNVNIGAVHKQVARINKELHPKINVMELEAVK